MPNHIHALIAFKGMGKMINRRVGTLKRFLAYVMVQKLEKAGENEVLQTLKSAVNKTDRLKGKLHVVFEPSFDCKECYGGKMLLQKLNYMHYNPCKGVWQLTGCPVEHRHSSAKFYASGEQGVYPVTHYMLLGDIDLID